ncbi:uncharacterized protein CTHT_0058910 [Thermochaetoides thermophila DSM 1495]|uniref:Uncharacterized protein n=1 Tax=Chaetomium thermophilum (strain DSM 1495 / CBS 144.50 / IMI 039719) TaxID=759272 RepID=G0SCZ4_CHATD|nr:hypothetical protein CTHT_0058910 [Thermochaetoides thermophila DSM 1495]EGS19265.1 hypothetical protein CTHT_0058910 [Thermochaetoides thermophila DSM 1495]
MAIYTSPTSPAPNRPTTNCARRLTFLDLPPEIRLQIYCHLLSLTPLLPCSPSKGYPAPIPDRYEVAPILIPPSPADDDTSPQLPKSDQNNTNNQTALRLKSLLLLSPDRPQSYLPSSLLLTNRQIYLESRHLPFTTSEFIFLSCFGNSAGVAGARAFFKRLKPWQQEAVRWLRIEVCLGDLVGCNGGSNQEWGKIWRELCGMLLGLRGLRIRVGVSVLGREDRSDEETTKEKVKSRGDNYKGPLDRWVEEREREDERGMWRWVEEGLGRMPGLRQVEIEVWDDRPGWRKVGEEERVRFCGRVREVLNRGRGERGMVKVVCVRRVSSPPKGRELFSGGMVMPLVYDD